MNTKTYKGRFTIKNPEKYRGDPTNIIYRSGWERTVMVFLDNNNSILEWSSEEVIIPYVSPWDNRVHRYFPDFWVKAKTNEGVKEFILEVKPERETQQPKKPKRVSKRFLKEVATWGVNKAKWVAARHWCERKGMEFQIITENDLNLGKLNGTKN